MLASSVYLPSAGCLAMAPVLTQLRRSGRPGAALADYDAERGALVLTTPEFVG